MQRKTRMIFRMNNVYLDGPCLHFISSSSEEVFQLECLVSSVHDLVQIRCRLALQHIDGGNQAQNIIFQSNVELKINNVPP